MFKRFLSFLLLIIFFTSCDYFSYSKGDNLQALDTIVDFTSVDFSPSFKVCDSLIDKSKKSDCFRSTMHQKIGEELKKYPLTIKDSINEVVFVDILIHYTGKISFQEITSTQNLKDQLPQLDSLLKQSAIKLSTIYPAIKRGIPVTTKYTLPIRIVLNE
ncbi:hypothetical protein [Polaribacter ponticola]|uniref:TonB C-terminal domain-containing protein n=1 Tax=Polaribacter ponticola TaxID=2978475 RepID=A0ABT5S9P4_9FLAO|nr:hypothetical protein [Polaribacter sp. MSW5]MDD7914829.1 hypothetical protein [Polaribacter sp. MSW5]